MERLWILALFLVLHRPSLEGGKVVTVLTEDSLPIERLQ